MSKKNCPCDACVQQARKSARELEKSGAPRMVIDDHVRDMLSGLWVGCDGCDKNDFEKDE